MLLLQQKEAKKGFVWSNCNVLVPVRPMFVHTVRIWKIQLKVWSGPPLTKSFVAANPRNKTLSTKLSNKRDTLPPNMQFSLFSLPCQAATSYGWESRSGGDNDQNEANHCNQRMMTSPGGIIVPAGAKSAQNRVRK